MVSTVATLVKYNVQVNELIGMMAGNGLVANDGVEQFFHMLFVKKAFRNIREMVSTKKGVDTPHQSGVMK